MKKDEKIGLVLILFGIAFFFYYSTKLNIGGVITGILLVIVGSILFYTQEESIPSELHNRLNKITSINELLDVCEVINKWCGSDDCAHALPFEPPWYQQLRAAIAKAKGE